MSASFAPNHPVSQQCHIPCYVYATYSANDASLHESKYSKYSVRLPQDEASYSLNPSPIPSTQLPSTPYPAPIMNASRMARLQSLALAFPLAIIATLGLSNSSKAQVSIVIQTQTPSTHYNYRYHNSHHGYYSPRLTYYNRSHGSAAQVVGSPQTIGYPTTIVVPYRNLTLVNPVIVGSPVVNSTLINPTLINSPIQSGTVVVTPGSRVVPVYGISPGVVTYPRSTQRTSISISF